MDAYALVVEKLNTWGDQLIALVPNVVLAFVVLIAAWLIAKWIRRGAHTVAERVVDSEPIRNLMGTIAYIVVLVAGAAVALSILQLGKAVTSLLAGAGIVGLAVGFAFQDIIANFIAGFFLAVRKPFEIGDFVKTNDHDGAVEDITLRTTTIYTPQGQRVIIPNKDVFQSPLINYTHEPYRRVDLAVGVSYDDDLEKVRYTAIEAARTIEGVVDNNEYSADCVFVNFGDSSVNLEVRYWIPSEDFVHARSEGVMVIKKAFEEADITIPYPVRTVSLTRHND